MSSNFESNSKRQSFECVHSKFYFLNNNYVNITSYFKCYVYSPPQVLCKRMCGRNNQGGPHTQKPVRFRSLPMKMSMLRNGKISNIEIYSIQPWWLCDVLYAVLYTRVDVWPTIKDRLSVTEPRWSNSWQSTSLKFSTVVITIFNT